MLYATGMDQADMNKAQVGISSMWYEGNPCNMHLMDLASKVHEGVQAAGMVGMRFNTIGVSDGISMGTDGMSYSLQSRDLIADSIETVMCAQWYDANISLPGCDKNMPGCIIAMGRLNRPALMVYGGTIKPGCGLKGEKLDIVSAFQSYGEYLGKKITEEERAAIVRRSCPGTRWPPPLKRWACPFLIAHQFLPKTRPSWTNASAPVLRSGIFWKRTSSPATS
jgi:dihydroxy-acid dehydratase